MTDQELLALVMAEGRAHLATVRNAALYDANPVAAVKGAHHLLVAWNAAREALRAAVLDRLGSEPA